jgi:hypothetical protein
MPVELEPWVTKLLLEEIELSGKLRSNISLIDICNNAEQVFGLPASKRRRLVQLTFANLKRKSIRNWAAYLDKFQVPYGTATLLELRGLTESASADSSASDESSETTATPPAVKSPAVKSPPPFNSDIDFSFPPRPPNQTMMSADDGTPAPSWNTPPRPPTRTMMSPDGTHSVSSTSALSYEGSKTNPYVINVDVKHPERNREFDIDFVEHMKHGDYIRKGYHIRVNAGVMDVDLWEARMYEDEGYDINRTILVKGPSRPFWMNKIEAYHRKAECESTKDAHNATFNDIANNDDRQVAYWLLVFPMTVTLDNVIFSGDPVNIESSSIGLKEDIDGVTFGTSIVFWKIAQRFGGRRLEGKKKTTVKDLFD